MHLEKARDTPASSKGFRLEMCVFDEVWHVSLNIWWSFGVQGSILQGSSITSIRICTDIFCLDVNLFRIVVVVKLMFMDSNTTSHGKKTASKLVEEDRYYLQSIPARLLDLNPTELWGVKNTHTF